MEVEAHDSSDESKCKLTEAPMYVKYKSMRDKLPIISAVTSIYVRRSFQSLLY